MEAWAAFGRTKIKGTRQLYPEINVSNLIHKVLCADQAATKANENLFGKQISVSNLDYTENEAKRSQDDSYETGKYGKDKPPEVVSPSRERSFSLSEHKRDTRKRKSRLEEALDDIMQMAADKGSPIKNMLTPGGSQRVLASVPNKGQKSFLDSDLLTVDNKPTALGTHENPSGSKKTSTGLQDLPKPLTIGKFGPRKLSQQSVSFRADNQQKSTLVSPHSSMACAGQQESIKAHIPKIVRSTSQGHLLKVLGSVGPMLSAKTPTSGILGRLMEQSARSQLPTLSASVSWAAVKRMPLRVQNKSDSIKKIYGPAT